MSPQLANVRNILTDQEVQDPDKLRSVLHVYRGKSVLAKDRGFVGPTLFGGGIVLWGGGEAHEISFIGWGSSEDQGRAHLVQHLLSHYRKERHLLVSCAGLKDQLGWVAKSTGLSTSGKPFSGYSVLKPVRQAQERREWALVGEPSGLPLMRAKVLSQAGFERAPELLEFLPTPRDHYPDHHLLWASDGLVQPTKVF